MFSKTVNIKDVARYSQEEMHQRTKCHYKQRRSTQYRSIQMVRKIMGYMVTQIVPELLRQVLLYLREER